MRITRGDKVIKIVCDCHQDRILKTGTNALTLRRELGGPFVTWELCEECINQLIQLLGKGREIEPFRKSPSPLNQPKR
jgi:hypothetical protein